MKEKSASENFLSRWSRRKQQSETIAEPVKQQPDVTEDNSPSVPPAEKDPADLPIWQQEDADPQAKQQALRDLFRKPGFNKTDGLEEYENDYNYQAFAGLGSVVTHEMKRMLERELAADEAAEQPATTDSVEATEQDNETNLRNNRDEEDKPIA